MAYLKVQEQNISNQYQLTFYVQADRNSLVLRHAGSLIFNQKEIVDVRISLKRITNSYETIKSGE